ncbi:NDP-sugar epimerase, includes UDP-GlcNAc-inverting 4,6-dehydratase FlaA1 and capsular polysaccharide biosynthesis protein EpsC [Bacteroides luti]|uniref:NDP-sugar epimerase, includes UDP-GlcNAc-inverting 4,6-dehydratase FlaA1 and capsular polysaccharide biosynthesis protein EpsC n=1 Tax=Bacteroides luti TaxID=1297750 RepID=A0A1M4WGN5_9BACE|nr:nucleoside-diphosphate sugar epimerase/dehydratase [Bacteroides luti]SHE80419.1 NDP-sugar epimerase, includes UDP-GlcNAc-inverting 4,6-dehydratase FlaA1 and capsular polysaccharide biosynthesis protein EpsC [Bacteroides luti]
MIPKITNWYFSKKALPYWGVLALDCLIVMFSGYVAKYLEVGGLEFAQLFWPMTNGIIISLVFYAVSFRLFRTYAGIIRYSSFIDLQHVAFAAFTGSVLTYIASFALESVRGVNMPDLLGVCAMFFVSTFLMWLERVAVKRMFDGFRAEDATPVAIYGTKAGGISIAFSIINVKVKKYRLVAFITDGVEMKNTYLLGKKVLLNGNGIAEDLKQMGVKVLLVSPLKSELFRKNADMIDEFLAAGIKIMMPSAAEEWDGKTPLTTQNLKEVDIEDLLPRDKIEVNMDAIGALLTGKKILITGAAGSIGSEMVRQVAVYKPAKMILIDQAETPMHTVRLMMAREFGDIESKTIVSSITNKKHMEKIFAEYQPDYVFHAAAYKHVPMMENNPAIAIQNNIYGTRLIADLAVKYGTRKFVMISTDKAVNPTNVMGCSKRICEIYCQSLNKAIVEGKMKGVTQFVTTRFGNVLGSNGSVIPLFREQIKRGGPLTVTHPDITRFFMLIPEACKLVLEAGTMGKGGEIFVFDMGEPVKITQLATRMINLCGAKDIEIKFTGLREGEKLYEEVLNDEEQTKPTHHPKIMIANVREYDYETACQNETRLLEASRSFDDMAIVKIMKEIVPEYKSKCSKYEVLDKTLNAQLMTDILLKINSTH